MAAGKNRERVARNFVERYGGDAFQRLLTALSQGESGQDIADDFGVSRERVRQWKNTFGRVVTLYQLHPSIERVLQEQGGATVEESSPVDLDIAF